MSLNIAIIGAGPAGYYTAEAALKHWGGAARIDIIDRLPTPYGLIRAGVAPDHQSIKAVTKRYEATNLGAGVRFVGNVSVGSDVTVAELLNIYDAVVLSVGAPHDKPIGIPGDDLPGVLGSAAFVGWYNGHPDFADLQVPLSHHGAAIIGNGNVAIDCARILAKTPDELAVSDIAGHAIDALRQSAVRDIHIVGRRGPHQASFTTKEAGELGHLERARPVLRAGDLPPLADDAALDPGHRKMVTHLRSFAETTDTAKPVTINFEFFRRPVAVEGNGKAERLIVETTMLENGQAVGTGELHAIPCGLVVACIGYRTATIEGVPYDAANGRFDSDDAGRVFQGLYVSGWARRGPSGTIGTNRPDGFSVVEAIVADGVVGKGGDAPAALDALLNSRGVRATHFDHWQVIDAHEIGQARPGAPREKLVRVADMLGLLG
ncbi:FAD-dependent oxidoreductase [Polymorphobacter fuscus]|uniref:Pyridine nucleotide-disulfide oxidoreductase n=1 Tax=Sandarakinorhabdus fusca TaxID=1439888 RepID=A0A7C9KPJ7_9SPHN|nr:FAD-dependent oxidoreductase [Polymorphobacter fuscus]KAB7643864.1 pyridine nucleotide-disulfide oxidoreductase [Polymorphobacter fuscus]MQT18564.1 pyridine nucleotide-disulfide oxidoreductase [Polymorphobacter fuscus]NJC07069.1 ferredoxin--NADP+ reductase [Polymorphobacter fuscus]